MASLFSNEFMCRSVEVDEDKKTELQIYNAVTSEDWKSVLSSYGEHKVSYTPTIFWSTKKRQQRQINISKRIPLKI